MHYAAVQQAIESNLPNPLRATLIAIAYPARPDLHAFCSYEEMAARSGLSPRTLEKLAPQLAERGLVRIHTRYVGGKRMPNGYELLYVEKSSVPRSQRGSHPALSVSPPRSQRGLYNESDGKDGNSVSLTRDVDKRQPPLRATLYRGQPVQLPERKAGSE